MHCRPDDFELRSDRLRVRAVRPDDFIAMVEMWTSADVPTAMGDFGPRTADDVRATLPQWMDVNVKEPDVYLCHLERKHDGEVVGYLGWGPSNDPIGEVDFAYVVRPGFRGQGYASEALAAMIRFCFDHGVDSVWGACHCDNHASARVMVKAGMSPVGRHGTDLRFIARPGAVPRAPRPL